VVDFRISLTLASLALVAIPGCRRSSPAEAVAVTGPPVVTVEVARVETLKSTVVGTGTILPALASDWTIYSPEIGRIESMPKAEGDQVKTGDVLVQFEFGDALQEVSARKSDVTAAAARLDGAKTALAKITAMFDRGFSSRNDFETAKRTVSDAEVELSRANQRLEIANSAADRGVIKARFPGVVAKRYHNEGDLVNAAVSDPVIRVIDPARVQVALPVSITQLVLVQPGQQATVVSAVSPAGVPATVVTKASINDPLATAGEVRLSFASPTTLALDTPVQAEILLDQRTNVVSVALAAALKGEGASRYVMIAGPDGHAHRRDVQLGLATRDRVEIVSGVAAGDRVIVKGLDLIADGGEIRINGPR
jgi:membrane fusion protein, multidrug efflux system